MTFEFHSHKPKAYVWFGIFLVITVFLNALLIQLFHSFLLNWNEWIESSVVLIVPWILFLFLPSVFAGLIIYYSLVKRYRFNVSESELKIEQINSKKELVGSPKVYRWEELREFHFSDFEDNEYFKLIFNEKKDNLIIHRNTGEFELFFEELKKHVA